MAATPDDIKHWIQGAQKSGATHLIVVCDTWDWDDYPVYVTAEEDVYEKISEHDGKNMQKIMEVYNLALDIDEQLAIRLVGQDFIATARQLENTKKHGEHPAG